MTEAELLARVVEACRERGLRVFHSTDPRKDTERGWPDLAIAGPSSPHVLFAELKSEHGQLTREQIHWRWYLQHAGCAWRLWKPLDWESGEIEQELEVLLR